jgi:hypothetical protein
MADRKIQEFPADPSTLFGAAKPFRFEVMWHSLTMAFGPVPSEFPSPAKPEPDSVLNAPVLREVTAGRQDREFETVLQRVTTLRAPSPQVTPPEPQATIGFPQFNGPSESRRVTSVVGAVVCVALGAAVTLWIREASAPKPEAAVAATDMGSGGWVAEWASDMSGSARGRQLSLYRPSTSMSDYRLEFLGSIQRRSLGCVFRVVDSNNYYAVKLVEGRLGTPLSISRFAVIRGVERLHVERTLALITGVDTRLKVRLEAKGPRFTVWVQNQVVEDWEDDRLKTGGIGFLNERQESGEVQSVQISFPTGGTGQ